MGLTRLHCPAIDLDANDAEYAEYKRYRHVRPKGQGSACRPNGQHWPPPPCRCTIEAAQYRHYRLRLRIYNMTHRPTDQPSPFRELIPFCNVIFISSAPQSSSTQRRLQARATCQRIQLRSFNRRTLGRSLRDTCSFSRYRAHVVDR